MWLAKRDWDPQLSIITSADKFECKQGLIEKPELQKIKKCW